MNNKIIWDYLMKGYPTSRLSIQTIIPKVGLSKHKLFGFIQRFRCQVTSKIGMKNLPKERRTWLEIYFWDSWYFVSSVSASYLASLANCSLNKDECYEDKTFVAKSNLNSKSSIPHSVSLVYNNASEDETLHILDTFDTVTGYKKEVCNLKETAQKDTVSDVIQVDKLSKQAFPCRKQYV